jgi:hypothetical protein
VERVPNRVEQELVFFFIRETTSSYQYFGNPLQVYTRVKTRATRPAHYWSTFLMELQE